MSDPDAPAYPSLIPLPERLEGPRVLLRPYRGDDGPAVFAAIDEARDHLAPWMDWVDRHRAPDDSRDYCLRMEADWLVRHSLILGMWDRADGRFLGGTGFHAPDWSARRFEIGYWIRPTAEGRGFVTEAVRLQVDLAFAALGARRIELWCDARNGRSRRVAERCGFVFEGRLRNRTRRPDGGLSDDLVFSLVPGDPGAAPTRWPASAPAE
jgi:RimJ/RimL family protein N-acetyltransferase